MFVSKRCTGVGEGSNAAQITEEFQARESWLIPRCIWRLTPTSPADRRLQISSRRVPDSLNKWEWPSGKLRRLRFVKTVISQVWIICTEASLCLGTSPPLLPKVYFQTMVYFQPCSLGTLPPFPKPYSSAVSQSLFDLNSLPFHCPSLIRKSVSCGLV